MKGLVCQYCGGNHFTEEKDAYICDYCHTRYDKGSPIFEIGKPAFKFKAWVLAVVILLVLGIVYGSFMLIETPAKSGEITQQFGKNEGTDLPVSSSSTTTASSDKAPKAYTEMELQNPSKNVLVAELSLDPEDIKLAEASVKKYGGAQAGNFEKRLAEVKNQSDQAIKNSAKQSDHPDQLVPDDPKDGYTRLYYFRQNGLFQAGMPNFTHYSPEDIIKMWGQPDEILTDDAVITKNLGVDINGDIKAGLTTEGKILWDHSYKTATHGDGTLTWRDTRAYIAWLNDAAYGTYSKALIYTKQGKPNVYFDDEGKIYYVSPIMKYLAIDGVPENFHPYEGLGKYPDDFPNNYPKPGSWTIIGDLPK